eukprot:TRINITY_DN1214_c0_g3_i1.p1 TRINITY_DN1214_c0_g3~~TRINITY_DN1214_c0_g3_i1.p1  ORF type:complete len:623 (+),score=121.11 TRINITY_DN1214_c0_g3_i1:811-2679(+)
MVLCTLSQSRVLSLLSSMTDPSKPALKEFLSIRDPAHKGGFGCSVHGGHVYTTYGDAGLIIYGPTTTVTQVPLTAAPDTLAPATPFPQTAVPTSAPDTPAPATAEPTIAPTAEPTLVPDTPAPLTSVPPTAVPTDAPPTRVPLSSAPHTDTPTAAPVTPSPPTSVPSSPETPSPLPASLDTRTPTVPTQAPEHEPEPEPQPSPAPEPRLPVSEKTIGSVGGVAAGAAAAGVGPSAGAATRLVAAGAQCEIAGEAKKDKPWALHPTGLVVEGSEAAGMVLGNVAIMVGFTVLCYVLVQGASHGGARVMPGVFEGLDAQGWMRFPSAPLFLFQMFYQGTSLGGMQLVLHPPSAGAFVLGVLAMGFCLGVPLWVWNTVQRDIPTKARYVADKQTKLMVVKLLVGPGEWVSVDRENHWVNRYASVVRTYREDVAWYSVLEFAASFALAGLQAVSVENLTQCGHVKLMSAIIFLILMVVEGALWPHARYRDAATDVVLLGMQLTAMLLMAAAYYEGDRGHWTMMLASRLLFLAVIVILIKVAVDVATEIYIIIKKRRARLQEPFFETRRPPSWEQLYSTGEGSLAFPLLVSENKGYREAGITAVEGDEDALNMSRRELLLGHEQFTL